jgi:Ca-activated chloride channel family protein
MTFASPYWAWWLFVLPVLALFKIAADARAREVTLVFAASERLRALLQGGTSLIRSGVRFGLQLLGLGFFILALTRPQVGEEERQIDQTGRNILIAMDCSKSMLANDVQPNRLTRAKLAAQDLLEKLPGDRVGLIAFAGRAFLQAPLTTDHEAVVESIQSLDHTTIPRGGSSLGAAIALALHSVEQMPGRQHALIIFTDGQETDNAMLATARDARKKNLLVLPVGVGTPEGEMIPDPDPQRQGDYLRDEKGAVIKSHLEVAALQELARVSGGEYVELNSQALSQTLVDHLLSNLERQRSDSRQISRPIDRYQWPLFAGIFCLVMSLIIRPAPRRQMRTAPLPVNPLSTVHRPPPLPSSPVVAAAALMIFLGGGALPATGASRVEMDAARRSYDDSHFDLARDAYKRMSAAKGSREHEDEIAYGIGATNFMLRDYEAADRGFSDALKSTDPDVRRRAQRGLATALYDKGDLILAKQPERTIKAWTDSRDHFDAAMKATPEGTPEYKELKENRDFVQKRLDEVKQQQQSKSDQEKKDQEKKDKQQGKGSGKGESQDQPQKPEDSNEPQERKEGGQKKTDAMQKQQEAVPEGEIRAGEEGKPGDKNQGNGSSDTEEDKRNDKTGFSPQEARSQLRNYADDQKSVQYLMRDEKPAGGKDY